jgi:hypothetical protein
MIISSKNKLSGRELYKLLISRLGLGSRLIVSRGKRDLRNVGEVKSGGGREDVVVVLGERLLVPV